MFTLVVIQVLNATICLLLIESALSRPAAFVLKQAKGIQQTHRHQIKPVGKQLSILNSRSCSLRNMVSLNINAIAEDETRVYDLLASSLERYNIDGTENEFIIDTIEQSSLLIQRLGSEALSHTTSNEIEEYDVATDDGARDLSSSLRSLSQLSLSTSRHLQSLIYQINNPRSKKTSGNAWRTLQSVVNRSLDIKNADVESTAIAFSILSLGIVITTDTAVGNAQQKMIASAIFPNSPSHIFERETCKVEKGSKQERLIKSVARDSLLHLLGTVVEENGSIDCIARIETAFGVGSEQDKELCSAVANLVKDVFGSGCYYFDSQNNDDEEEFFGTELDINKDKASPTLALVAQCRPWEFIKTDKLVRIAAADLDLWYSAELVCDASVASVTSNTNTDKNLMATNYPKLKASDKISTQSIDSSLRQDTIAHLATRALIDTALDLRLYRRADLFASKFYAFGGPERFAEARFLHACETITKVVKRKQPQIIEKQIARIDECVARVSEDLNLSDVDEHKIGIGEVPIETMPQYIRDFALRRLRTSNMSAAASRLANLWGMNYEEDPAVLAEEEKRRQLTYVQWNDEGSPGNIAGKSQPLPDLISDAVDLAEEFKVLLKTGETVGFDAEWGEDSGVAVLQLSTVSHSILLDIPALSSNDEGCRSLQATVGQLFAGLTGARYIIGFGCKEDIKRLRDSPCSRSVHWFPHNNCAARDLRPLIAEASPSLGGKGGQHLGLSRMTESFLGKQLDKAEQCSDWCQRPLSTEQREYAALDAWACAAIHAKIAKLIGERYKV
eukprot:scaffold10968_cov111-Skeletonema_dohrnii-CCMP3373.AAC.3